MTSADADDAGVAPRPEPLAALADPDVNPDSEDSDSITMLRDEEDESDSKSSDPLLTVNPLDSVRRRGRSSSLNPVAMTVIFTASFIFSSSTAPKIMLASSSAAF